ncbi:MAG TPA: cytochrome c [Rhodothermales bacterium]|nr:cytochrome c [Rhodothermales bacterium]
MKTSSLAFGLVFAAFLAVSACGTIRRGEPIIGAHAPPNEGVARGLVAFDRFCSQCHPGGEAGLGPALNNKPAPAFLIKFQVRHGLGAMPSFSREVISPEELQDITRYLVWLRHTP